MTAVNPSQKAASPAIVEIRTPADGSRLLNKIAARFWVDATGDPCIGVWECVDSESVRAAAALVCPPAKVLHLEDPQVPLEYKVMPPRMARIEDRRWKLWK